VIFFSFPIKMAKTKKQKLVDQARKLLARPGAFSAIPMPRKVKHDPITDIRGRKGKADIKKIQLRYDPTHPRKRLRQVPTIIGAQKTDRNPFGVQQNDMVRLAQEILAQNVVANNLAGINLAGPAQYGNGYRTMPVPPIYSARGSGKCVCGAGMYGGMMEGEDDTEMQSEYKRILNEINDLRISVQMFIDRRQVAYSSFEKARPPGADVNTPEYQQFQTRVLNEMNRVENEISQFMQRFPDTNEGFRLRNKFRMIKYFLDVESIGRNIPR
jgi:hypothetical protein